MIAINSDINDFGNIMILALRFALGRKTYMTYEVSDFIKNNKDLINERICICMISDINNYLAYRKDGIIIDDECDYNFWIELNNWLYKLARERNYNLIEN